MGVGCRDQTSASACIIFGLEPVPGTAYIRRKASFAYLAIILDWLLVQVLVGR